MKEYWVNVYENPFYSGSYIGGSYFNYHTAISVGKYNSRMGTKCIYRIHVKMDGGYNKYKQHDTGNELNG